MKEWIVAGCGYHDYNYYGIYSKRVYAETAGKAKWKFWYCYMDGFCSYSRKERGAEFIRWLKEDKITVIRAKDE